MRSSDDEVAALAARVPRVTLGSLVSGNTYRHPALLAKMAAGVDRISGGRLVLGIGAAWQENEHRAFGLAFPPLRERMEKHRKDPVCAGCHRMMDPIGFALENYDGTGRWRTTEEGRPIDASGTLFNGAAIDGVVGLRREIAKRPEVFVGVLTEKMMTYAVGRGMEYYDMPAVRKVVQDARASNYRFSDVVLGVVRSVPFQMKETK